MSHIFVSHSTKDDVIVNKIDDALVKAGFTTWIDHKRGFLNVGDIFDDKIQAALVDCASGIFVISNQSIKSNECLAEWRSLIHFQKPLYVLLTEEIDKEIFPYRLRVYQYASLATNFDAGINKLIDALKTSTATPSAAPITPITKPMPKITGDTDKTAQLKRTRLIGRESALQKVADLLKTRITTVIAVGGSGKSRLAYEIAASHTSATQRVWHYAEENASTDRLLVRLKTLVGLGKTAEDDELYAKVDENLLLVFDNAESITDENLQTQYSKILGKLHASGAQILVTSRAQWKSLDSATYTLERLTLDEAEQVCLEMLNTGTPDDETFANARKLAEAAKRHPRLIEWAIAQLMSLPLEQVLADLNDLKSADAQEALFEMIGKTADQVATQVGDDAKEALLKLNVFRGGFTYEAAQKILDAEADHVNRWLKTLIAYGFVKLQGKRYDIDPIVNEALTTHPAAHSLHCSYYGVLGWQYQQATHRHRYAELDLETANIDAAFEWAIKDIPQLALLVALTCRDFLNNRGRFVQSLTWHRQLVAIFAEQEDKSLWSMLQNSLGEAYRKVTTGDYYEHLQRAIAAFQEALLYAKELKDHAEIYNNLGNAYNDLAKIDDTQTNLQRALEAHQATLVYWTPENEPFSYGITQHNLGNDYISLSRIENHEANLRRAIDRYEEALIYWKPENEPAFYAMAKYNLGNALTDLATIENRDSNLSYALGAYKAALIYHTPEAFPIEYAGTQNRLGKVYLKLGDLFKALTCYREAEKYYRLMGIIDQADLMLRNITEIESQLNDQA